MVHREIVHIAYMKNEFSIRFDGHNGQILLTFFVSKAKALLKTAFMSRSSGFSNKF